MSTTTDALTTAVLLAPGMALSAAVLISQRRGRAESAAVLQVLADSAAQRANRAANAAGTAPPDGGEPTLAPTADAPARLATVLQFRPRNAA
ncbi:hypothetical protein [Kitasatospora sp. NPDC048538]|uniref:hypothetical protein n=1 Tax=unclassified Kitasatospora TaxID=2633591 RepID=UPI003404B926